jgi:hypothetical protein
MSDIGLRRVWLQSLGTYCKKSIHTYLVFLSYSKLIILNTTNRPSIPLKSFKLLILISALVLFAVSLYHICVTPLYKVWESSFKKAKVYRMCEVPNCCSCFTCTQNFDNSTYLIGSNDAKWNDILKILVNILKSLVLCFSVRSILIYKLYVFLFVFLTGKQKRVKNASKCEFSSVFSSTVHFSSPNCQYIWIRPQDHVLRAF